MIAANYPGRVALIEMHVSHNGSPLYLPEANYRMGYYPSPYYTPWLYRDGVSAGSGYTGWRSGIVTQMNRPSTMRQSLYGTYNSVTRQGTINAKYYNDSTVAITARIYFCVTEDSIYYLHPGGNGDAWHNHVARDYLPTQAGTTVTIQPGDSAVQTRNFTLGASWNADRCDIVSWIQQDVTRRAFQSGSKAVNTLTLVQEEIAPVVERPLVVALPNPCTDRASICFASRAGAAYRVAIYDASGRPIRELAGTCRGADVTVIWDRRDGGGNLAGSGVYFYRVQSAGIDAVGKVVVK